MSSEALHQQVAEAVAVRVAVEFAAIPENESALTIVAVDPERGFPLLGRSIGAHRSIQRDEIAGLLAAPESAGGGSEHPEVPAILARAFGACTTTITGRLVRHLEPIGLTEMRVVPNETQPDSTRQPVSQIVLARTRRRHVLERIGNIRKLALADEVKGVFRSTAASSLIGYENVDLRILPVAHVVHEVDLGPHEIKIAVLAIEEDAELDRWCDRILRADARWQAG